MGGGIIDFFSNIPEKESEKNDDRDCCSGCNHMNAMFGGMMSA